MTIPDFGSDLVGVVLRTAVVYVCLVLGFRFLGKREAGQLSTLDLVVLLVISNAVQNAMVGENTSLIGGLVAAAVILVLDLALHAAADHWAPLRNALDGEPTILVEHGRILVDNLRHEGISDRELAVALRQNQLMSAEEALFVFLETNGQISVIPRRDDDDASDDGPPDLDGASKDPAVRDPAVGATHPRGGSSHGTFRRRHRRPGRLSGSG
ncbi:MAG TPA: YetF domain-containing protein [Candidatus Limnocylindrales bacterium]|nr:YetF domain-containing protein [Candidatus Limnocylindrales bacterium]